MLTFVGFAVAAFMQDRPGHVGPGADAFGEQLFLGFVVVAAAAGDEQRARSGSAPRAGPRAAARNSSARTSMKLRGAGDEGSECNW